MGTGEGPPPARREAAQFPIGGYRTLPLPLPRFSAGLEWRRGVRGRGKRGSQSQSSEAGVKGRGGAWGVGWCQVVVEGSEILLVVGVG